MSELYHKYVFDTQKREFVGDFESMYANEDKEGFDSWHQENLNEPTKLLSFNMLKAKSYDSILDVGCGKGVFTNLLSQFSDDLTGIDISPTAVQKAKERYSDHDFKVAQIDQYLNASDKTWDLIVVMEILSYLENWREVIKLISTKTNWCFISLFIPDNPIGFVKSASELESEIMKYFDIDKQEILNQCHLHYLAKAKK